MKRLLRVFDLSKSEQRVVLIVILLLTAIAFIKYQRRIYQHSGQATFAAEMQPSPSPEEIEDNR